VEDLSNPEANAIWYFLLRSADRFYTLHNRYPGAQKAAYESDLIAFSALVSAFLKEFGIQSDLDVAVKELYLALMQCSSRGL
jgi:hypothetical protein